MASVKNDIRLALALAVVKARQSETNSFQMGNLKRKVTAEASSIWPSVTDDRGWITHVLRFAADLIADSPVQMDSQKRAYITEAISFVRGVLRHEGKASDLSERCGTLLSLVFNIVSSNMTRWTSANQLDNSKLLHGPPTLRPPTLPSTHLPPPLIHALRAKNFTCSMHSFPPLLLYHPHMHKRTYHTRMLSPTLTNAHMLVC
ncbi:unnamed protein product [Closterium sp. NIES-54]